MNYNTELFNELFNLDKTNILSSLLPFREVISRNGSVNVDNIKNGITRRTEVHPIVYGNTSKLEPVLNKESILNNLSVNIFQHTLAARAMLCTEGLEYVSTVNGQLQRIESGIDILSVDTIEDIDFSEAEVILYSDEVELPEDIEADKYPIDLKANLDGNGDKKVWSKNYILVLDSNTPIGHLDIVRYLDEEDEYLLPIVSMNNDDLGCNYLDYRFRFVPSVFLADRATVYSVRSLEDNTLEDNTLDVE